MIDVAFALHDRNGQYSKNVATAIASIFENTKEQVRIHLLHDNTLVHERRLLFKTLCNDYSQEIFFYKIANKENFQSQRFSAAAFFRLYLPDVLPQYIHKIIYLDADICVNLDIIDLWNANLGDKSLGGVRNWIECSDELKICKSIGIAEEFYFNSGVLVMDIDKIRKNHNLVKETCLFLEKYPFAELPDQDALNYIFNQEIFLLEGKYNTLVKDDEYEIMENRIYHFAGAKKPWNTYCGIYTNLYCKYFAKTPWFNGEFLSELYSQFDKKTKWLENFYQRTNRCKIILFGAGYLGEKLVHKLNLSSDTAYFVDNNNKKWDNKIANISIFSPEVMLKEKGDYKIVIALIIYYDEIKNWLIENGYKENIDFFDGRKINGMEINWW